ncbi:hypothetical protein I302_106729 [Kwoniella bestiolae CBS 10118]|uniref:Uncharacterized protein n=1 Tax=Kwoniella bestiolae CBS 10118 TaxID=1296100 RepID=A0A1B9G0K2_9TREE|nr:hypothetical protein I302_06006 [Kwoniella bestiolae CBS 10118]OCF24545.1 hypothetical protein I302_06006 [Kwoniella bestiolae CBS 10118]
MNKLLGKLDEVVTKYADNKLNKPTPGGNGMNAGQSHGGQNGPNPYGTPGSMNGHYGRNSPNPYGGQGMNGYGGSGPTAHGGHDYTNGFEANNPNFYTNGNNTSPYPPCGPPNPIANGPTNHYSFPPSPNLHPYQQSFPYIPPGPNLPPPPPPPNGNSYVYGSPPSPIPPPNGNPYTSGYASSQNLVPPPQAPPYIAPSSPKKSKYSCGGSSKPKYETAEQKKKRKNTEKAEIAGAFGEVVGAVASAGDGGGGVRASCGGGGGEGSG